MYKKMWYLQEAKITHWEFGENLEVQVLLSVQEIARMSTNLLHKIVGHHIKLLLQLKTKHKYKLYISHRIYIRKQEQRIECLNKLRKYRTFLGKIIWSDDFITLQEFPRKNLYWERLQRPIRRQKKILSDVYLGVIAQTSRAIGLKKVMCHSKYHSSSNCRNQ